MTIAEPSPDQETRHEPLLVLPANRYPKGWFMVGWSDEFPIGEVRHVERFNRNLALWRGESGELHALDAYCLHLGANLAVQGTVVGEDVRCPWHGWQWDGDGRNTLIPYSAQQCKQNIRIESWEIREWYGAVVVWHDLGGGGPEWEPPTIDELEGGEYLTVGPTMRATFKVKAHPQMPIDNGADFAHIPNIHGMGVIPWFESFGFDGHHWQAEVGGQYGAGKGSTRLTPDGPVPVTMQWNLFGIGLGYVRWPEEIFAAVMPGGVTPIDDEHIEMWFFISAPKGPDGVDEPNPLLRRLIDHQIETVQQDFFTWENMKSLVTPALAPEEVENFLTLRRWAQPFYALPSSET